MRKFIILTSLLVLPLASSNAKSCFDHSVWEKILKSNVDSDGFVDYDGIRINKGGGNFYEYVTYVEIAEIKKCPKSEKIAFWINAYNVNVIRQLLAKSDLKQLDPHDPLFKKREYIANKRMSLAQLKNRVLRSDPTEGGPMKELSIEKFDPRIHFALSDGNIGSPKLSIKPFIGAELNSQLQAAAKKYVNDPDFLRIENGKLVMSDLFQVFQSDFYDVGGVAPFLTGLTDPFLREDEPEIDAKLLSDFPQDVVFIKNNLTNSIENKPK